MKPDVTAHFVHGRPIKGPFDTHLEEVVFALGCFWGAERRFWETDGVFTTAVGYAGGTLPDPDYKTDPAVVSFDELLKVFWESHDPTQGMRQGNDIGPQYRSAIFARSDAQRDAARLSLEAYQGELRAAGYGEITTEIRPLEQFYYAEDYHQQYLAKNPAGYCPTAANLDRQTA